MRSCTGAWYTGRGPVCGVITRRCGTMGCCDAGFGGAAGAAEAEDAGAAAGTLGGTAAGGWAGGVTTTAGGGADFSTEGVTGAATAGGAAGLAAGGVTTTVFSGAAGLSVTVAGFSAPGATAGPAVLVAAGATAAGRAEATAGLGGAEGRCCCCSRSFSNLSTSPGLEIFERSSLGLISGWPAFSFDAGTDLAEKCLRILSASSSSTELE